MILDLVIPFLAIGLAEIGDKTQLALLCLSTKTTKKLHLFLGAILAFLLTDGIAIAFGGFITNYVPERIIKSIAGVIFIIFGIYLLAKNKKEKSKCNLKKPFYSAFLIVFLAELGDKTQIASVLFATVYNPWLVLTSVICVLALLSLLAIYLGKVLAERVEQRKVTIIAGILFIIIGIWAFI